jgi:MioC protein
VDSIEILVGSTLGGTEYVAEATQPLLEEAGFTSTIHFTPDLTELDLKEKQIWLICLSTHGAGDYPDNFKLIVNQINTLNGDLSNITFGLVGIGDSNYDTYCFAAKHFDILLREKGATRLGDIFNIDIVNSPIPEDYIVDWIPLWIKDLLNLNK